MPVLLESRCAVFGRRQGLPTVVATAAIKPSLGLHIGAVCEGPFAAAARAALGP
jgi:hypothetical protein